MEMLKIKKAYGLEVKTYTKITFVTLQFLRESNCIYVSNCIKHKITSIYAYFTSKKSRTIKKTPNLKYIMPYPKSPKILSYSHASDFPTPEIHLVCL